MAILIGQIIYDLVYKDGHRESTSTNGSIIKSTEAGYEAGRINIYNNICNEKIFTKLGIQAPSGTRFYASSDGESGKKEIIVGKTGIFELTENIPINYLAFVEPAENIIIDYTYQEGV